ncbi:MAG: hypothetical protein NXI04_17045 [Planctomycetaceae bacterium]|nr:hypothetical protein [Planctomycetaceae bacterium]
MRTSQCVMCMVLSLCGPSAMADDRVELDVDSPQVLVVPQTTDGTPAAGRRVRQTAAEYSGTDVYHTVYLPESWTPDGPSLPIIFEYTGNYFPASGSTGEVKDAQLGYCLTGGQFIWVSLPYIKTGGQENQVTWWGDTAATVEYAKVNVPRIIEQFHADRRTVLLCGFSRGAIGVNYLGLHDDEIAALWTGFISHDHFDGIRVWGRTEWGSPLEKYRREAAERLRRLGQRPYLVSHNGRGYGVVEFVKETLGEDHRMDFLYTDSRKSLGAFPNQWAKSSHTDAWAVKPSDDRRVAWQWINQVIRESTTDSKDGQSDR